MLRPLQSHKCLAGSTSHPRGEVGTTILYYQQMNTISLGPG